MERTLAIIKPDAVEAGHSGTILERIEREGFRVIGLRREQLSAGQARAFYAVHRERPFFGELTAFMSSGPCVVMVFEGDDAIKTWRGLLGATNPAEADEGTLRKRFGDNIQNNGFHGSDATDTAAFEISHMFSGLELA